MVFSAQDFGNWDVADLADVLGKVMVEDSKTPKRLGPIQFTPTGETLTVIGSSEALAAVAEWVKKLKK